MLANKCQPRRCGCWFSNTCCVTYLLSSDFDTVVNSTMYYYLHTLIYITSFVRGFATCMSVVAPKNSFGTFSRIKVSLCYISLKIMMIMSFIFMKIMVNQFGSESVTSRLSYLGIHNITI